MIISGDPAPAVIAVTPNPAMDVTITVASVEEGATHRIDPALKKLGGKGINVAEVAAEQGYPAYALGPLPRSEAEADGLSSRLRCTPAFSPSDAGLRSTYAIHAESTNETWIFNEPGLPHSAPVWTNLAERIRCLASENPGSVVTISGSFPPGVPVGLVEDLIRAARAGGAKVIVDSSGDALLDACAAGADLVKPNAAELAAVAGTQDPLRGARALLDRGAHGVVASLGPKGLLFADAAHAASARLPQPLAGNPTGAGDAVVAALATMLTEHETGDIDIAALLRRAVAWSAAAVTMPTAGVIGDRWPQLIDTVIVSPDV